MTERVLLDARVRAWVVREAGETACYLGIQFRNAPQLTVRAAARPDTQQSVSGSVAPETLVTYFAKRVSPQTDATRKLASASRRDKILWWNALPQSGRDGLVELYRFRGGLSLSSLAKAATVLFPVVAAANTLAATPQGQKAINSIIPGAGTAGAKALAAGSAVLHGKAPKLGQLIDIGAAIASSNLPDAAKARAAGAAAAVLQMPAIASQLAAHGVSAASLRKTSNALAAASNVVKAKMAPAGSVLSRLEDAQAATLIRQANPRLSTAAARQQLKQFVYLKVGQ